MRHWDETSVHPAGVRLLQVFRANTVLQPGNPHSCFGEQSAAGAGEAKSSKNAAAEFAIVATDTVLMKRIFLSFMINNSSKHQ
jgi:hypothetical protein